MSEWIENSGASQIKLVDLPPPCIHENYDMMVNSFIEQGSHFFLSAVTPGLNSGEHEGDGKCPKAIAFASIDGNKVVFDLPTDTKVEIQSHLLGRASLKDIIEAEGSIEAVDQSNYDLTKNSCVHYAGALWRALELKEDRALADFLVNSLLSDDGFINMARNKIDLGGLRVLSAFASGEVKFNEYVKNIVISQLNIEEPTSTSTDNEESTDAMVPNEDSTGEEEMEEVEPIDNEEVDFVMMLHEVCPDEFEAVRACYDDEGAAMVCANCMWADLIDEGFPECEELEGEYMLSLDACAEECGKCDAEADLITCAMSESICGNETETVTTVSVM